LLIAACWGISLPSQRECLTAAAPRRRRLVGRPATRSAVGLPLALMLLVLLLRPTRPNESLTEWLSAITGTPQRHSLLACGNHSQRRSSILGISERRCPTPQCGTYTPSAARRTSHLHRQLLGDDAASFSAQTGVFPPMDVSAGRLLTARIPSPPPEALLPSRERPGSH
jgi:hypothetical protein